VSWTAYAGARVEVLLELDLVLEKIPRQAPAAAGPSNNWIVYKDLLFLPDNDLLDFVDGRRDCPDARMQELVVMMRECWTAATDGADR
jgi:antitoxin CptB